MPFRLYICVVCFHRELKTANLKFRQQHFQRKSPSIILTNNSGYILCHLLSTELLITTPLADWQLNCVLCMLETLLFNTPYSILCYYVYKLYGCSIIRNMLNIINQATWSLKDETVDIEVFLMNGKSTTVRVKTTDCSDDILEVSSLHYTGLM